MSAKNYQKRGLKMDKSLFAALPCTLLIAACGEEPVEQVEVVRPIKILTLSGLSGGETLEFPGEVDATENADLSFEVAGRIIEFPVIEGQNVTAGELVARVDPADYQSALDQAQANYNATESNYRRYQELFESRTVSEQDVEVRQRNFEVNEAQLQSAQKSLNDTRLVAPFTGRIALTYVDNFTNVLAKQPVALLQDASALEIVVNVPEQDWQRARPGLTLAQRTERVRPTITIASMPGREFPGVIVELATAADPVTRTFRTRLRFVPPDDVSIFPGMSANVTVRLPRDDESGSAAIWIPASAVLGSDSGGATVWTIDPSSMQASSAEVTLGQLSSGEIEILSGIELGDRIAVSGIHFLSEGMEVRELTD